jgi:hypothetical protein
MNIGQLRSSEITDYGNGSLISYTTTSRAVGNGYYDTALQLNTTLDNSKCYCLKLGVERLATKQVINVRLKFRNKDDDVYQTISTLEVSTYGGTPVYTIVFQPNANYDQIVFVLDRTDDDLTTSSGVLGRTVKLISEKTSLYPLVNVIDRLAADKYSNLVSIKQLGVRGNTGTVMCINGEEIRIGPNGTYEINNGTIVNFLGFAVTDTSKPTDSEYFILDFLY